MPHPQVPSTIPHQFFSQCQSWCPQSQGSGRYAPLTYSTRPLHDPRYLGIPSCSASAQSHADLFAIILSHFLLQPVVPSSRPLDNLIISYLLSLSLWVWSSQSLPPLFSPLPTRCRLLGRLSGSLLPLIWAIFSIRKRGLVTAVRQSSVAPSKHLGKPTVKISLRSWNLSRTFYSCRL